jgi:hypothetical protein
MLALHGMTLLDEYFEMDKIPLGVAFIYYYEYTTEMVGTMSA